MTTFIRRILGVLGLDAATFEDVERDRTATRQAMIVVVLASIGAGIGNAGIGSAAPAAIVYGTAASLLAWATWASLIYYLGTRVLPEATTRADLGEVLRTLGFAAAPGMFRAFEVFGGTRWFVLPVTSIWMIVAMTIGVRQALDYSTTTRAVALALLGWAVSLGMAIVIGLLFSTPVS
ncbi:MAG TPA: YIP1 family protein [Vicinamibacterales bacterium]|nr:YIP1 family protein [Vicinamibacterales bacterium]